LIHCDEIFYALSHFLVMESLLCVMILCLLESCDFAILMHVHWKHSDPCDCIHFKITGTSILQKRTALQLKKKDGLYVPPISTCSNFYPLLVICYMKIHSLKLFLLPGFYSPIQAKTALTMPLHRILSDAISFQFLTPSVCRSC
jgi:hypothetical protein